MYRWPVTSRLSNILFLFHGFYENLIFLKQRFILLEVTKNVYFSKLYFHRITNQVELNQLWFVVTRNCRLIYYRSDNKQP